MKACLSVRRGVPQAEGTGTPQTDQSLGNKRVPRGNAEVHSPSRQKRTPCAILGCCRPASAKKTGGPRRSAYLPPVAQRGAPESTNTPCTSAMAWVAGSHAVERGGTSTQYSAAGSGYVGVLAGVAGHVSRQKPPAVLWPPHAAHFGISTPQGVAHEADVV
jgi:hypothetical protein